MSQLLGKLEAAIAETERIAIAAAGKLPHWVRGERGDASSVYARNPAGRCPNHPADGANPCDDEFLAEFGDSVGAEAEAIAEHVVRNDPNRVLRRVARDRKLLERHKPVEMAYGNIRCHQCREDHTEFGEYDNVSQPVRWPCDDVRDMAEDYEIEVES